MQDEWAENLLADFNLWSAGAGASANDRASLDHRLAPEPDVRAVVINLLSMLNAVVKRCQTQGKWILIHITQLSSDGLSSLGFRRIVIRPGCNDH